MFDIDIPDTPDPFPKNLFPKNMPTYAQIVEQMKAREEAAKIRAEEQRRARAEQQRQAALRKEYENNLQNFKNMVSCTSLDVLKEAIASQPGKNPFNLLKECETDIVELLVCELSNNDSAPWKKFLHSVAPQTCRNLIIGAVRHYINDGYPAAVERAEKRRRDRDKWYKGAAFYRRHCYGDGEEEERRWREDYHLFD